MSPTRRRWTIALGLLVILAIVLGCSAPSRILGESPLATLVEGLPGDEESQPGSEPTPGGEELQPGGEPTPGETAAPEPLVVTHQGSSFNVYSLDGTLVETRSADGLDYARPNTAQVVGESIYYVDSGGQGLGGVVRRVTSSGVETLDFTAVEDTDTLTFAISEDETRIAWTQAFFGQASRFSKLWIAGIDGSNPQVIVETGPPYDLPEYYALEAVRWVGEDLIYAYQVTGIGGYILFFGWSSFYRYSPADGSSVPLVPASEESAGPCWYAVSPDGQYAVGGCGEGGMRERELSSGTDTSFPVLPDQGQQGGAAYSPSGERLAYAIARGNYEDESGQVLVRLSRGKDPTVLSTQTPGYFERILWADEERMVVGYAEGESNAVDLLTIDGTRTPIGDGRLIGLMQPAPTAAAAGLPDQVNRGQLKIVRLTANGDIAGPGIKIVVRNPGSEDITTTIPCGFVFEPDDASDQRLMLVQPVTAVVPAGGEVTLTAYVVCIDSGNAAPDDGATYTLGTMQSGDLLKLAQCACGEDLAGSADPLGGMGVMIAGWMIREGASFADVQAQGGEGASSETFGGTMSGLLDMFAESSESWFDRCNIPSP
ncbi:MAG: hypothetical protein NTU91_10510 [Chloroflexi bacterium]|nr:hypothetical protein [Chloroflexota bacterium]